MQVDEKGVIGFPESGFGAALFHVPPTLNVNSFHTDLPHINPGAVTNLSFPNGIMSEPGSVEGCVNPKIPLRAAASGLGSARSTAPMSCKVCRQEEG